MNPVTIATVRQLLDIAPVVLAEAHFAIKGGTIVVVFIDHSLSRQGEGGGECGVSGHAASPATPAPLSLYRGSVCPGGHAAVARHYRALSMAASSLPPLDGDRGHHFRLRGLDPLLEFSTPAKSSADP
jgi:hypothetical protein